MVYVTYDGKQEKKYNGAISDTASLCFCVVTFFALQYRSCFDNDHLNCSVMSVLSIGSLYDRENVATIEENMNPLRKRPIVIYENRS